MLKKQTLQVLALLLGFVFSASAQVDSVRKDSVDFYEMSLEQLLKMKAHGVPSELEKLINSLIAVASKKPLNVRESPSIVSLVTEDEIKKSGARDLIDVLRMVPGIDFGTDVESVTGIGVRGNWAHEGKVLLLIDGQEMNEILFATTQFGNHYPIDNIKRIEIIRGPGSAIYGGFAEYGVINIITKQGEDINGVSATATYGQMQNAFGRRNLNVSVGQKKGDLQYSISGLIGQGNRSDQVFTDLYDSSYSMPGNASLNPAFINGGFSYKGLSIRAIGDFYNTTVQDGYDQVKSANYKESYNSLYTELKYVFNINDKLTITPRINFKKQTPWRTEAVDSITPAYIKTAKRTTTNLTVSYNATRNVNVVFGGEKYTDVAVDKADGSFFSNGSSSVEYFNYAFFAQGLVKTRFVNVIIGARYDKHNAYGDAFVPRVGLTKKYKKFHFKSLYSNAFRAPSIENINLKTSAGIKPEKTQVAELELGYQVTRKSIFTVNFFDITTNNPIVYYYDTLTLSDTYINFGQSGTRGVEAEYRVKGKWGSVAANYAFYTADGKKKIGDYEVADDPKALLGFANHKLNLNGVWNITKDLSLNPTVSFFGKRWAYTTLDTLGSAVATQLKPTTLVNIYLRYSTPLKGLSIGAGVYDLLNQKFLFIQPYNGYHAPFPGPSREFVFRLQYNFNLKKKDQE
ncbi:MAG: TonB-dependent receptor plug domain-containing protein [Bacteroidia bacterium]